MEILVEGAHSFSMDEAWLDEAIDPAEKGMIGALLNMSMILFPLTKHTLGRLDSTLSDKYVDQFLRDHLMLGFWGKALNASDGALDKSLENCQSLRDDVITLMYQLLEALYQGLTEFGRNQSKYSISVNSLLEKAEASLTVSDTSNSISRIGVDEIYEDITSIISALDDLAMSLERPATDTVVRPEASRPVNIGEQHNPLQNFFELIQHHFPKADDKAIKRHAQANCSRLLRLQDLRGTTMEPSYASHESRARIMARVPFAWLLHKVRREMYLPEILETDRRGVPFVCSFCQQSVDYRNDASWINHVLKDLGAWICLDPDCSSSNKLYGDRVLWISHLLTHMTDPTDENHPQCSLCLKYVGTAFVKVVAHFEEHLIWIATMIVRSYTSFVDHSSSDKESTHVSITTPVVYEGTEGDETTQFVAMLQSLKATHPAQLSTVAEQSHSSDSTGDHQSVGEFRTVKGAQVAVQLPMGDSSVHSQLNNDLLIAAHLGRSDDSIIRPFDGTSDQRSGKDNKRPWRLEDTESQSTPFSLLSQSLLPASETSKYKYKTRSTADAENIPWAQDPNIHARPERLQERISWEPKQQFIMERKVDSDSISGPQSSLPTTVDEFSGKDRKTETYLANYNHAKLNLEPDDVYPSLKDHSDLLNICFHCSTRNSVGWKRMKNGHLLCDECDLYVREWDYEPLHPRSVVFGEINRVMGTNVHPRTPLQRVFSEEPLPAIEETGREETPPHFEPANMKQRNTSSETAPPLTHTKHVPPSSLVPSDSRNQSSFNSNQSIDVSAGIVPSCPSSFSGEDNQFQHPEVEEDKNPSERLIMRCLEYLRHHTLDERDID
ncbi:hypothetical protein EJ05DRAFT_487910 [Pseudovirgaria hyperparasitica]|uniref:GATA-type domain-containing protein n=1 Tax=Pseudovirgaria hyperparasitica TaxID=470096 RepID=A0A6A6W1W9_9PEZI|nr:uncharacterized protein EJ05DRAFT_487910 [Pseudovirgaria hyperparasitica]KAF2756109.1 hypothetical protein EJ05DRAFT_487910 [Pseudovirgaria hyperparasitica]